MSMPSDDAGETWLARFSDGRTAATSPVRVCLIDRGLEILDLAEGPMIWPYGAIGTAAPLGRHSSDVLVTYAHQDGATVFVDNSSFAAALATRAPQLTARSARLRHAAPWLWACAGVLAIFALVWAMDLSPARAVAKLLPDRTRNALGAQVVGSMTAGKKVCASNSGRAAVDAMVERLSAVAGGRKPFKVVVVDWGLVNAFAAPGEQIVLTRGLIAKAGTADEVAGVLAHEMGHGLELHPEAGLVRALGLSAAIDLLAGGSAGTLANIGLLLTQLSYTRTAEREADAHALRILKAANISPQGIIDFFSRVEKADSVGSNLDILRSHPQVAERRKLAEAAPAYAATPALSDHNWQALRSICG